MFGLLRNWRRRRVLARRSIPDSLWQETLRAVPVLSRLDAAELRRLRELAVLFLHEKSIEPAGGLALTDAMRVRIAALACLPVLELGLDCYDGFVSVIVYPGEFMVRGREQMDEAGVVHVGDDVLSGEAWEHGPVVLAWADIEASGRGDGYNVVAHEFAHKLDALEGAVNGMPPLPRGMQVSAWSGAFQAAFDQLLESLERGEETWLDPYAAESPAEFFAVVSELFFDVPEELAAVYPSLYEQLAGFYRQNPAARRRTRRSFAAMAGTAMVLAAILLATPAEAHHSVAGEFDEARRVTLSGIIVDIEWVNPHVTLLLEVEGGAGEAARWRLSSLPVSALERVGLNPDVLMGRGATVEVDVLPARDGTARGWVLTIRYPDGHHFRLSER